MKTSSFPPFADSLSLASLLSALVALLMGVTSLAGLLFPSALYPSEELRRSFLSNDAVNLFIGLPFLLGSILLARRGKLLGRLCWPGALFYGVYNAIAYAVAMPFSAALVANLVLAALNLYALAVLLSGTDAGRVRQHLAGRMPERFIAGVLIALGGLFFLRALGQGGGALTGQIALSRPEEGVLVADLLTTPLWVGAGILLWRRQAWGYVSGAGLLFQACMLFVGLLAFFVFQPFVAGVPFRTADFIVIALMSLICWLPFGLVVRATLGK